MHISNDPDLRETTVHDGCAPAGGGAAILDWPPIKLARGESIMSE